MASNEKSIGQDAPSQPTMAETRDFSAINATAPTQKQDGLPIEHEEVAPKALTAEDLPSPEEVIERLGIANWRELEKKVVKRLDMTLLPMLWILYVFNYLDRASLG